MTKSPNPTTLPAWQQLGAEFERIKDVHMRDLFAEDPKRFDKYSLKINNILFDYSKNRIDEPVMEQLLALAEQADVTGWRDRMLTGDKINHTEQRSVLHTALRNFSNEPRYTDGEDVSF